MKGFFMKKIIKIKSRIDEFDLIVNIPERWNKEKIVIGCHGFDSSKDSEPSVMLGEELEKAGIAYARFTLPYHAERRIDPDDFSAKNCLEDIELVERTIKNMYPKTKVGLQGTSFRSLFNFIKNKEKATQFFCNHIKISSNKNG